MKFYRIIDYILYSILFLQRNIIKNNFKFENDYGIQDVLIKFIHGLRKKCTNDASKFFIHEVIKSYSVPYLKVSPEEFYLLMFDFVIDLWQNKILSYEKSDGSVAFNPDFQQELNNLVFYSFDLMALGESKYLKNISVENLDIYESLTQLHEIYLNLELRRKLSINSLLKSMVISASVKTISVSEDLNNIFIENLKNESNFTK